MNRIMFCRAATVVFVATAFACQRSHAQSHEGHSHAAQQPTQQAGAVVLQAVAVLSPASGSQAHGTARFTQDGDAIAVVVDMEGLTPNQQHAIHVHEFGDCTAPDAMSAGSHYNPEGHPHALPTADTRHAGDLGNLQADAQGKAHYTISVRNCTIAGAKNPILGRAVIVHAKPDDGGQPVGNAGGRIACGVIGVAKPPENAAKR